MLIVDSGAITDVDGCLMVEIELVGRDYERLGEAGTGC
jgi:hypothetical protein